jgi:hypothetical protein
VTGADQASSVGTQAEGAVELLTEGRRFGGYLLRSAPSERAVERYASACPRVFKDPVAAQDRALLGFVSRHRWSLPLLDAVCGLLAPQALLRKKLFLMLAILETVPAHAGVFTSRPASILLVGLRLAWLGSLSALMALAGVPLLFWARRAR